MELRDLGLVRGEADHSVYFKFDNDVILFMLVYVDDILIFSNSLQFWR